MSVRVGAVLLVLLTCAGGVRAQDVVLRGQGEPPRGEVVRVDRAGVVVRPIAEAGTDPAVAPAEVIVPLDRVRTVLGARRGEWDALEPLASALWRAQTRIDRDDVVGAQVVIERWGEKFAELSGPSAAAAARLELRLALQVELPGSGVRAAQAWARALDAADSAREGPRWFVPASDLTEGMIDAATGLSPVVPPFWLDTPATRAALESVERSAPTLGARAGALREWFLLAAKIDLGQKVTLPALPEPVEPALALVADLVRARSDDGAQRAEARARLESRLIRKPAEWERAWIWLGLGRSLLREGEREQKLRGVGYLLRVPASGGWANLAAIARADAAVALAALNLPREAGVVKGELERDDALGSALALAVPALRPIVALSRPAATNVETPQTAEETSEAQERKSPEAPR
ncbi:MAG: hypothetical protein SFY95_01810 [Planctomycetota bacterium]|nr:hypothetical protein [Planctomycetota bacterium]